MNPIGLAIAANPRSHPAPPGHPECHERLAAAISALSDPKYMALAKPLVIEEYDLSPLGRVHSESYVTRLSESVPPGEMHDEDTFQTASSFGASCGMTWSLLSAVAGAFGDGPLCSFVLGRPPGHHAGRERAMGFCMVNHVAVAAQFALDKRYAERVAIVDF
ncbi:MAG: histone deacetylase family protein, partial [bacterium]|nr:histone deacetylase family protein [bacterium]